MTTIATYLSITKNLSRTQARTAAEPAVKTASAYYAANIGKITSIKQFVGNYRLLSYALDAYGLGSQINSTALIKKVLEGGVTNPKSLANTLPQWKAFATAFSFIGADPTTASGYYAANIGKATSIDQFVGNSQLLSYALDAYGLGDQIKNTTLITQVLEGGVTDPNSIANTQPKWKAFATAYDFTGEDTTSTASAAYASNIVKVTSIDDFIGNSQVLSYALDAYGLGDQINQTALIKQVLQGGVADPNSLANTQPKWKAFATAFDFAGKGAASVSTPAAVAATEKAYVAQNSTGAADSYYAANIGKVTSIDDLVGNSRLLSYALDAYGLGDQIGQTALIKQVLQGGVADPNSLANTQPKWKAFATAFDFVGKGAASVSSATAVAATENAYIAQRSATAYYSANIGKVTSISSFVGDSQLLSYALTAYGLGDQINQTALITKVLQGGVTNPNSIANTQPKWKAFATAFDFVGKGAASATSATAVAATEKAYGAKQSAKASAAIAATEKMYAAQMSASGPAAIAATEKNYVEQQLENEQGQQDVGVQLALYFHRVAPNVTNAFGILADKNLLQVVETIFGLPNSFSAENIDTQAKVINGFFKISDLQNPAKLNNLTQRFTAQYDSLYGPTSGSSATLSVAGSNAPSSSSSASAGALAVLGGIVSSNASNLAASGGILSFSDALMQSLQGFKIGG